MNNKSRGTVFTPVPLPYSCTGSCLLLPCSHYLLYLNAVDDADGVGTIVNGGEHVEDTVAPT